MKYLKVKGHHVCNILLKGKEKERREERREKREEEGRKGGWKEGVNISRI